MDLDTLYNQLTGYVDDIKSNLLQKHINNKLATPEDYNIDVKSFCILSHAAIEEFIETLCLKVVDESIKNYKHNSIISRPLISLMHFKSSHENYLGKNNEELTIDKVQTIFDYNRKKLDEVKDAFSKEIFNNHGISLKYLRNLMMPISIDIPKDVNWANSLKELANERGAYAHKFLEKGRVRQSIEPEKAKVIVEDCLELCKDIRDKAKKLFE